MHTAVWTAPRTTSHHHAACGEPRGLPEGDRDQQDAGPAHLDEGQPKTAVGLGQWLGHHHQGHEGDRGHERQDQPASACAVDSVLSHQHESGQAQGQGGQGAAADSLPQGPGGDSGHPDRRQVDDQNDGAGRSPLWARTGPPSGRPESRPQWRNGLDELTAIGAPSVAFGKSRIGRARSRPPTGARPRWPEPAGSQCVRPAESCPR